MRISDWSSDVCSSDLQQPEGGAGDAERHRAQRHIAVGMAGEAVAHAVDHEEERIDMRRPVPEGRQLLHRIEGAREKRSEEHTSELQSLMRISYAVFCLKKKKKKETRTNMYQCNKLMN